MSLTPFGCFLCIYGRLVVDHPKFRIIICWAWFDFGSLWQVQLFDSMNYLKSFSVGDVWVAVGWSSDVVPAAKRMSNVAVVVPKSGSSLWADLWVWYGCLMNNAVWICDTKLSHWFCCFVHCRWYHVQQDYRPTKSAAEPEAHPHSSTNGSTSAYKALGAYPSGEMSSQERHHCTWRTLCRRSLKIRTRGSQSWTRTSSGECLRLRSSRNASSWNPCPARRWRITSGWCRGCRDHGLVCSGLCCKRYQVYWTWNQDFRARVLNLAKLFFPLL